MSRWFDNFIYCSHAFDVSWQMWTTLPCHEIIMGYLYGLRSITTPPDHSEYVAACILAYFNRVTWPAPGGIICAKYSNMYTHWTVSIQLTLFVRTGPCCQRYHKECSTRTCADDCYYCCTKMTWVWTFSTMIYIYIYIFIVDCSDFFLYVEQCLYLIFCFIYSDSTQREIAW